MTVPNCLFYFGAACQCVALGFGVDPFVNGLCLMVVGATMFVAWR